MRYFLWRYDTVAPPPVLAISGVHMVTIERSSYPPTPVGLPLSRVECSRWKDIETLT